MTLPGKKALWITAAAALALLVVARTPSARSRLQIALDEFRFNRVYSSGVFPVAPTRFLVDTVENLPAGRALDVAMGQGRNAVWLARQGWKVTGFDIAEKGLAIARSQGVAIDARWSTVENFPYGVEQWDLIVLTYAPFPFRNPEMVTRLEESLKPGGLLLIETFVEPNNGSLPPGVFAAGEAPQIFRRLTLVSYIEGEGISEWMTRRSRLVRYAARKP